MSRLISSKQRWLSHWLVMVGVVCGALGVGGRAATLTVDPALSLTNFWGFEWNTNGNFEGWTLVRAVGAVVTNGALAATSTNSDPQLSLLSFTDGPDLDLGYNDYLDLRLQLPASYAGNVQIFYGVTNTPGISAARVLTISNAFIPQDGLFHTYRFDLGLEKYWRGTVTDLRLDPVNVSAAAFAVDYLRIGDLTGDEYYARYSTACPAPGATNRFGRTVISLESKRFRFCWDPVVATNSYWRANMPQGTLRNAEEVWQVYVKHLGYFPPSESWTPANRDGKRYKVNIITWEGGYWAGGDTGNFGYLNITPDGLQVDTPTWVLPHEGMHVFQMHQGGSMPGEWWEGHANYGRERWLYFYDNLFPSQSNIDAGAIENGHMTIAIGRDYYLTWPFFLYLDENPDALPDLGDGTMAKLWQTNASGAYPYQTLEQLTTNTTVKDIVGYYARRMLTFDFSHQAAISNALRNQNPMEWQRYQVSELVRRGDDTNWWRVPLEMAPQQGGYAIHELVLQGTNPVVSVNFHGLPDAGRGADWRASLVALATNGVERYSALWNSGLNSITLSPNESRLFLVVAATPNQFVATGHDDLTYPYRSHPSKQRLHYEAQLFNALPRERDNGSTNGLIKHSNGGGYKASTATVDATAYVGPNARVVGTAKVRDYARIEDFAVVTNSASVSNYAVVSGHALVRDSAVVRDSAKVRDWAIAGGTAVISGKGRLLEHARITDGVVGDYATAKGSAWSQGGLVLGGYGVIDGDFLGGRAVTNGFAYGHQPYVGVPDAWVRVAPDRLFASYNFAATNGAMARDQYGVTDAYLAGNPAWRSNDLRRAGVLAFNGADQYAALDKSLCDLKDFSIAAWLKWNGGAPNQPIWHLGSATNRCMFLTPDDGSSASRFYFQVGATAQSISGDAVPADAWTHVVVTLSNTTGRLYVNGTLAGQGLITNTPDQLLAGNTNSAPQHHYLARGADPAGPFFNGSLDSVQVYSKALSEAEISWLYSPPTNAGTVYVELRATQAGLGGTTWTNLGSLGDFTKIGTPTLVSNVAGTGIPGVQFNGTNQAYQGPNSVAAIEGGSDRSIEVWAYNQALASEETMVSWGHRGYTRQNMGFNFGNSTGWGAATHWGDDVPWSANPSANSWHHLVYTYSNSVVRVYVDGVLNNTKTLGGALDTFTNEPINLACQRDTANGTRSLYFSGYLNQLRIHGGVLSDDQVANNYLLGPAVFPINTLPVISSITNRTIAEDTGTGSIPLTVGDRETAASQLALAVASSDTNVVPVSNISFGGAGSNRTVAIWPATNASGITTITITVADADGGSTNTSFNLTVTPVNDPPAVILTSPTNLALLTNGVTLSATASDPETNVVRVDFVADGRIIGQAANAPFGATWTNPPLGGHRLWAVATDATGLSGTSPPVQITIGALAPATLIATGAVWKFLDDGSDQGSAWRSNTFNDTTWRSGPAQLGFGDADEASVLSPTNASGVSNVTYYFRRVFLVPDPTKVPALTGRMIRDDGAVIYLNGAEVWRSNMPTGLITSATFASTAISGTAEKGWRTNTLPVSNLLAGVNLLAAEVHQFTNSGADLSFEFELTAASVFTNLPALNARFAGKGWQLNWPSACGPFLLYSATNLISATNWERLSSEPVLTNGDWTYPLPPPTNRWQFFRLQAQ